jgi:ATP-dependent helicase/nuclease subunit A
MADTQESVSSFYAFEKYGAILSFHFDGICNVYSKDTGERIMRQVFKQGIENVMECPGYPWFYLDFGNQDAAAQVERLVCEEKLTREQADAVNCEMLERFLKDPLAEELRNARRVWREFPFTRLVDAREADPEAPEGEQVLLQGVIDCFFETEEGLTVIDFKTDRILSETDLLEKAETYRIQLETYSKSLEKIFEKPVNRQILYFLGVSAAVEL